MLDGLQKVQLNKLYKGLHMGLRNVPHNGLQIAVPTDATMQYNTRLTIQRNIQQRTLNAGADARDNNVTNDLYTV